MADFCVKKMYVIYHHEIVSRLQPIHFFKTLDFDIARFAYNVIVSIVQFTKGRKIRPFIHKIYINKCPALNTIS
jgi:hypothetical protein